MANLEYETLVAYFDADTSGLKSKGDEVLKICDAIEKKLKNLNLSFGVSGDNSFVKNARDYLRLQTESARSEKANEQAKRATVATGTEQIKQERERAKLAREIEAFAKRSAVIEQQAKKASIAGAIQEIKLEREKLKLIDQISRRNRQSNESKPSVSGDLFTTVLGASTVGGLAVNAVSGILSGIKSGLSAGLDQTIAAGVSAANFERTKIAIAGVIGGANAANAAIAQLEKTAANTPGLTFRNALDGYQRLRAVQFGAQDAERALLGLSKVKVLSGGTEEDLQAVLINFAQIRSMGKLTGDELKETLGRFPYFAQVLQNAFGTISTEKIGELQLSSDEFFERIFAEMDKIPPAAGGASDAFDKLTDQFYKSQVAFGEPLLEPVTESLGILNDFLKENKDAWQDWGQYVGDIIRGVNAEAREMKTPTTPRTKLEIEGDEGRAEQRQMITDFLSYLVTPRRPDQNEYGFAQKGKETRLASQTLKSQKDPLLDAYQTTQNVFNDIKALERKAAQDEEVRNYKEKIKEIGVLQATRLTETENFYTRQKALIASSVRQTTSDELNYLREANAIEKAESDKKISTIEAGIAKTRALNEKLIASYLPQDQGKIRDVKERELASGVAELDREKAKAQLDEANRTRQVAELEKRVFEERRKAAIEFKTLSIEQIRDGAEKQAFEIQKGLDNQTVSTARGYADLIDITRESQLRIAEINRQQLNLQLQDASLSHEQRLNVITKAYLDEQRSAEENSRSIRDIEKRRTAALLDEINERTEMHTKFISGFQSRVSGFSIFGDVGAVTSVGNFGKLIDRAKDLKKFFDDSNRSQAQYFKDQAEHYRMLVGQTQDVLERLKRTREAMIPDAPDAVPAAETPQPAPASGSTFMPPLEIPAQVTQPVAVPPLNRRAVKADIDISDAEGKLSQYKAIAASFGDIATRFNSLSQDIDKNYGAIQTEVFGLYDSLGKGIGDYTVFDQIIEKNYLAQRAMEGSELSAKVTGLSLQLDAAQQGLDKGSVSPADFGKIKTALVEAQQAQQAFNFETDLGRQKLDLLATAAERFKALTTGDKVAVGAALYAADLSVAGEKNRLAAENLALEKKFYEDSELWAAKRKNALLNYEREIYEARKNQSIQESVPIKSRIELQQAQIPSYSEMFKNDIAELPNRMADVLGNIAAQWDGTWSGLFKGVVRGFGQMLADMAQQYLKAAVSKLIGKLVGTLVGFLGGAFGGSLAPTDSGNFNHGLGALEFAGGGLIAGKGTATSDSIAAWLSNGEYVQKARAVEYYGVDFMNALNNLEIPKGAYSTGGYVSGAGGSGTGAGSAPLDALLIPKAEMFGAGADGSQATSQKNITINNTVNQTFKTPRSMTAPKSTRQQTNAAISGLSRRSNYD